MPALSTAQQIRLRLSDIPRIADLTNYGDGTASSFVLSHYNITTGSAFVPIGGTAWSATGATFDASGMVSFAGVVSANSAFRLTYVRSVFSDDEIGYFTANGGDLVGAAILGTQTLLVDAGKRASWGAADGSTYSDVGSIDALWKAYSALRQEQQDNAAAQGGAMINWSLVQGDY